MNWKDYYHLRIQKNVQGTLRPYFEAELQVDTSFTFEELKIQNFESYSLSDLEKKRLTPEMRKVLLRLSSFNSREFERIGRIFADRILEDKSSHLEFSTSAGGVYLFLLLIKICPEIFEYKTIQCLTSEMPLEVMKPSKQLPQGLHFFYRPELNSFTDRLPGLWQETTYLDLFEIDEQKLKMP
jgi:hypothetical protein